MRIGMGIGIGYRQTGWRIVSSRDSIAREKTGEKGRVGKADT